ncbi:ABC transporter ATP-binding protein [Cryobacterium sp. PH29-G1]|uniref:ATP-binding cassette domain-containing protein n=1 Tax=Cryobacterium sp. PH29-G1 TaxID=3046211 RepID=UPI0024BAB959|nr:ABC transporter ATP-binding protein [Cryobacterium sp. PH29-G1]MDJ0349904.1 ABC transporter ATP-binding protein [Cryobacterium sp. PH29-G1]
MSLALSVQNLTVSLGRHRLLHNLGFSIEPGERVALLGASGSGKSLTAAAVLGCLGAEFRVEGSISVFGTVAAVYQDSAAALNPLVSIGAQLAVPISRRCGPGRTAARRRVAELLDSVGIDDPERTMAGYAAELSGGQRQRVCIALALACRARLLIADEPTTALDVVNQARVLEALHSSAVADRAAILFITHDLAVAASICDRAIVLENGKVAERATMAALIGDPQHPYSRALVDAARPAPAVAWCR